ncbi:abhydrolase domain-containing protein 8 [Lasius niger]|uniref:acylglycerol lipase n=1 Tax=Lasius niger TaxID=67767 RepID=A0A0J7P3V6_LASNI|nr:abhydrolase domain-containing protein 8 [Lasius niger]
MATKVEETPSSPTGFPWYGKIFECWRNRSRVSPGRIELPDCDFFIVAPRRTLRVLRPTLKSGWYYESTAIDRPESVNDNFFARWTRRPHPSGNCRCSFRQSTGALSTTEERIISAELNRIRTSLCEGEKNARDIEELEQKVSVNLQKLRDNAVADHINETNETTVPSILTDRQSLEQNAKQQIVRDLERYINTLLEEVLDDTVKHVTGVEKNDVQHTWQQTKNNLKSQSDKSKDEISIKRDKDDSFIDINSRLPIDKTQEQWSAENECKKQIARVSLSEGYVNPAFVGSTDELASLDFDHSARKRADLYFGIPGNTESIVPEKLDCVDSGINSVETIEFQLLDQEPSFEQSLLQIIDEKLGRGPLTNNSEEDSSEKNLQKAISEIDSRETIQANLEISPTDPDKVEHQEDAINTETNFEKLRLEFQSNGTPLNDGTRSKLDTKLTETAPIELKDYRKEWTEFESISSQENTRQSLRDSITFRRNRKPTIVFLHGFGSSAEVFEHQLQYFSSLGYPCIAPDMLGHGMSSAPGRSRDYHFGKLLKDLDAVLHHYAFKPGEKCVLVAHNYGCSFATALACKYDSNIHQLVLISGGGPTPLAPPSTECAGHCCLRAILAPLLMCGLHRDILYSARGRQHPYCGHESTEQWPSHMKYVLDGMIWPQGDYAFHRKICTPTLLVHGLRDNKVSLVQECQMERTMMKAFLEAIPMAGHSPMTECPQQLNHMIHCFIDLWKNKKWQQ